MNISRRNPWTLWPNSICPSFIEKPAVDKLQGDSHWRIDIEFEYTDFAPEKQKDIFCIVPKYTGLSIFEKRLFVGIGYHDEDDWIGTEIFLEPNLKYLFTYEHLPNDKLNIYINKHLELSYDLSSRPLAVVDEPIVFIGTDKHIVSDQPEDTDIKVYLFKITVDSEVLCHHDFSEIIHGKSIDKTGNCNFLYQMS